MDINKNKILFFNPRSAQHNHRLPVSILQVVASVCGKYEFAIIDGNLEKDPWAKISAYLHTGEFGFFAVTVMPGPQLKQAILYTKTIKDMFPSLITIWGGYFASNHTEVCMKSGYIDFIIRGHGDIAFPRLLEHLNNGSSDQLFKISNLAYVRSDGAVIMNDLDAIPEQDSLPPLPLEHLGKFYPLEQYIVKTFIGKRTLMYHSSLGCPHGCAFCGVASLYSSSWKGKSAKRMFDEIMELKSKYSIDAIEIVDSNFFAYRPRTTEFCKLMKGQEINWWAEGRIDTLNQYADQELLRIKEAGCRLVFMGAESGNDRILKNISKGGTLSSSMTLELVKRFGKAGIIPQLSFVLGFPSGTPQEVDRQAREEIRYIKKLKRMNLHSELVLYLFSPIPFFHTELFNSVLHNGFSFPQTLDEWLDPQWERFDLRRGSITPWLLRKTVRHIRNFETVLSAAYPGVSNFQINLLGKRLLGIIGKIRYFLGFYFYPVELKALLKLFSYELPGKEGFYSK